MYAETECFAWLASGEYPQRMRRIPAMRARTEQLEICECRRIPKELRDGILYLSREYETAIHNCACGCGARTVTPLHEKTGWILTESHLGPSLHPSIGNQRLHCRSHYWVTEGKIVWCLGQTQEEAT